MAFPFLKLEHPNKYIESLIEGETKKWDESDLSPSIIQKAAAWLKNHREEFGEYKEWSGHYGPGAITKDNLLNDFKDLTDEQKKKLFQFLQFAGIVTDPSHPADNHLYVKLEVEKPENPAELSWLSWPHCSDPWRGAGHKIWKNLGKKAINVGLLVPEGIAIGLVSAYTGARKLKAKKHRYDKKSAVDQVAKTCYAESKEFMKNLEYLNWRAGRDKHYKEILSGGKDEGWTDSFYDPVDGWYLVNRDTGKKERLREKRKLEKTPAQKRWGNILKWLLIEGNLEQEFGEIGLDGAAPNNKWTHYKNSLNNALADPVLAANFDYREIADRWGNGLNRDANGKLTDTASITDYMFSIRRNLGFNHPTLGLINDKSCLEYIINRVIEINNIPAGPGRDAHIAEIEKLEGEAQKNILKALCEQIGEISGLIGGEQDEDGEWFGGIRERVEIAPGRKVIKIKDGYLPNLTDAADQKKALTLLQILEKGEIYGSQAVGAIHPDNDDGLRKKFVQDLDLGMVSFDPTKPVADRYNAILTKYSEERARFEAVANAVATAMPVIGAGFNIDNLAQMRLVDAWSKVIYVNITAGHNVDLANIEKYVNYSTSRTKFMALTAKYLEYMDLMKHA